MTGMRRPDRHRRAMHAPHRPVAVPARANALPCACCISAEGAEVECEVRLRLRRWQRHAQGKAQRAPQQRPVGTHSGALLSPKSRGRCCSREEGRVD